MLATVATIIINIGVRYQKVRTPFSIWKIVLTMIHFAQLRVR